MSELDNIQDRLEALPDYQILNWFWLMIRQGADKLATVQILSLVVVSRPADWNRSQVRQQHERGHSRIAKFLNLRCFLCESTQKRLYFHHLLEVQNGGDNNPRNLVPLCFACHKSIHPWLIEEAPYRTNDFESTARIMPRAMELLEKLVKP